MTKKYWATHLDLIEQAQVRLARILSVTKKHTSWAVKFWKQVGQLIRERLPIISSLNDLRIGEGFVSGVPIIHQSKARRGRIVLILLELIWLGIVLGHGHKMLAEGKRNLYNLIIHFELPRHVSWQVMALMIIIILTTLVYYLLVKPDDVHQALKLHKEEKEI